MNQDNFVPPAQWFDDVQDFPVFLIAGPCSAESEEQLLSTASELKKIGGISLFRAGIWKPRTRPGSFEGAGNPALKWLQQVRKETGMRPVVEVASPAHVEACLKHDIDAVWLGSRTNSNPFSVQHICAALKGTDIPVLVKNPINPDPELWIGALERVYNAGIRKIAAVHRGFYPFEKTSLRNIPKWEVAIELKTRFPKLPLICDPSHIAGEASLVQEIAQQALDLSFDGLMIESHINPSLALSDANQQLSPDHLKNMLFNLTYRQDSIQNRDFTNLLKQLRARIDSIDDELIELLSRRMDVVKEIAQYKRENNVTIFQLRRWKKIIETRVKNGQKRGLSEDFMKKLLEIIHDASIQKQSEIINAETEGRKRKKNPS